ncbi:MULTISPECIES: NAD(P)H-hydrate dehydratase [unclassified Luteimonas]|uniref:NAD(P)H-hydrate dehydratase n=1 Tax=unclassified Luteimonas TaxID=2629088 RepID=UPI0018F0995D|nr:MULTISPECIES: NAD(P)H-hydrate dehydratase [unclassified Luteimonas]MBJ6978352.1 NAD(P)H-hydrate dehydratase [Luteimonas sp. MC1895]MBJ6983866.1 NAD(P)H-hydrate dehydratase [Luteimonas sp. MC1750]QQO06686.1 NAD(P)H-hydrate dehydratase [Luteimonas sp. MC1750]
MSAVPRAPSAARALGAGLLRAWPLPTPDGGGKEARGRVLVVGGHRELAGAVRLAGEAALRAGAGKLQIAVARGAAPALAVAVPEARVLGLPEDANGDLAGTGRELPKVAAGADAVVLGPGAESGPKLRAMAARLLTRAQRSAVLDAGAIDLAVLRAWRRMRERPRLVLTPHHGEMASLLGCDASEVEADAARIATAFAQEWDVVLVLKSATTWIADGSGTLWVNRGGSEGLGTSGSGDVLAGIVGGLCARGATPAQAACWGVWLHARAGARLGRRIGDLGFLAREIAGEVPALLAELSRPRRPA